jgi:hypothetical protein
MEIMEDSDKKIVLLLVELHKNLDICIKKVFIPINLNNPWYHDPMLINPIRVDIQNQKD